MRRSGPDDGHPVVTPGVTHHGPDIGRWLTIYEIAAERAGVAMDRCLFVDDRLENVDAAAALGMTGVHYRGSEDLREWVRFLLDGQVTTSLTGDIE